jgi:nucleotide-binding universal stress UspA family protein
MRKTLPDLPAVKITHSARQEHQCKVTGLHVIPGIPMVASKAVVFEGARQEYEAQFKAQAEHYLLVVEKAARDAGVAFDCAYVASGTRMRRSLRLPRRGDAISL